MLINPRVSILLALSFLFVTTISPAQAQLYEGYFSGHIGTGMMEDSELSDSSDPGILFDLGYDKDIAASAAIGLASANYRSEIEVSYQKNDLNNIEFQGVSFNPATFGFSGNASAINGLVNAYFDFPTGGTVRPYVTGGLGLSEVKLSADLDDGTTQESFSDKDSAFAFQLGAGLGYSVTETVIVDLRYRYLSVQNLKFDTARYDMTSHNIVFGIRIKY